MNTTDVDYIIASDTDSLYINLGPLVRSEFSDLPKDQIIKELDEFCNNGIQPRLVYIFDQLSKRMRCYKNAFHMKRESISDRGLFVKKKRYALNVWNNEGVQYSKPKLKIMGIQAVRSNTSQVVRDGIKECINIMLTEGKDKAVQYVLDFKEKYKTLPFEKIATPSGINGLDAYADPYSIYQKGTPVHVKGALLYNKALRDNNLLDKYDLIMDGGKVKWCYLLIPNPTHDEVFAIDQFLPKELGIEKYIDYNKQLEHTFLEPIRSFFDVAGWELEKKPKLTQFFK